MMLPALLTGQRTTRPRLKAPQAATAPSPKCDTLFTAADSTAFRFSGYEKTLRSSRESFFITNLTDSIIDRLSVELTYLDMRGRMLDIRTAEISLKLAPGETRKADIRSWDTQKVMYYHLSPAPRTTQATPYRLTIRLLAAMRSR